MYRKFVGEARAKYNPSAPLIGVTPMGPINGTPTLHELSHAKRAEDGRYYYSRPGEDGRHYYGGSEAPESSIKASGGWVFDQNDRTWRKHAPAKSDPTEAKRIEKAVLSVETLFSFEEQQHNIEMQSVEEKVRYPFQPPSLASLPANSIPSIDQEGLAAHADR
jgi:hypothetical protein